MDGQNFGERHFATLFEDGRPSRFDGIATNPKLFDEATKRQASIRLVLSRELGNVENVGKNLFA